MTRIDIRTIMAQPAQRRELAVETLIAIQAREGIETTHAQAEAAYDKVRAAVRPRAPAGNQRGTG